MNRNDPIRSHILNRVRFTNRLQLYHRLAAEKTEKVKNKWNLTKIKAELRHAHAHTSFFFPFSWHPNSEEQERVTYFLVEKVNPSSEHLFGTPNTESIGAKSRAKTLDRRRKVEEEEAKKTVEFARAIWKFFEEMVSGRERRWLLVLELVLLWVVYKYVLVLYDIFFLLKMSKHWVANNSRNTNYYMTFRYNSDAVDCEWFEWFLTTLSLLLASCQVIVVTKKLCSSL